MAKSKRARTPLAEEADGAEQVIASQLKKKKPEPTKSESSKPPSPPSDYETGSETDSGSESDGAGQVQAANAKRDAAAKEPVLTRSKASATPATAAEKTKEVAESENEAEKEEKPKVTPFQRVFTEKDELLLLRALQEKDAWVEMDAFYELVKDRLSVRVTKSQLQEKLKRMKKKFKRMAKDGFKPKQGHELEAELMKKVWGGGAGHVKAGKAEGEVSGASLDVLSGMVGGFEGFKELGFSEAFLKKGMDLVDEAKREELKARWFKLEVAAVELFSVKAELLRDQAKSILEALKQSDN
ncbi:PREDICTED: uncharacterized protein LOC101298660 [Fragaria vesca subsp. vesca]|uniref:uncharacterized protein LOC101298660 n=1 Tax=Fragaria vesca subsp. vesca TaxID=101020 RepID=UPI0002C34190|nr:PREDICTED: uncharacterized protein LOC101298660 [Fragaria vesca subsp. vesca]